MLVALVFAALWGPAAAQPPQMVNKVETGFVRQIEISTTLELTGSVEAWQEIEVSAKVRGVLVSLPAEEGKPVKRDQVLFEQDSRFERIALVRAGAELDKAEAELAKMRSGFLPQEIDEARRAVAAAKAVSDAAREDWERLRPLADQEVISASEATRSFSAFKVAESEHARALARLDLFEKGFRDEEVLIALAEVKVREAAVAEIRNRLDDHRITAPADGVIVRRIKEQGEWANEGEGVVVMVVLDPVKLRADVPQGQIASIRLGQKARVEVDGLPGRKFTAEVTNIIPQANLGTRNFPVLMQVQNSDRALAAGMFARAFISVGELRRVMVVPREAVRNLGLRQVVYRIDPLPEDFVWTPPPPPPNMGGRGGRGGGPMGKKKVIEPDSIAREIEVIVTDELDTEVVIRPKVEGLLEVGSEIVIMGNSRLRDDSLLRRLNPAIPGAG